MQVNKTQQSFTRRDRLLEIQKSVQELWDQNKVYDYEVDTTKPKYFANFPYPYMNGFLHLGHAFSMSKAEFMIRYKKLKGYNTLYPQGYHCTGMPISAAAKKLEKNLKEFSIEELEKMITENKGGAPTQYQILRSMNIPQEMIPKFIDPLYWLHFFPKEAADHLKMLGVAVDHRRSFITTSENPYYNSFIEWQFEKLKEKGFILFGKRPSVFSPLDDQMCADHDRAEGEGVGPQEYTLIKIEITDSKIEEKIKDLSKDNKKDKVFLVAATLRPETMYGQTNCYVLPEGNYGVFEMPNNELWICSDRSMQNMSYQDMTISPKQVNLKQRIQGQELIGLSCKAPLSLYEHVYVWPMLTISMNKGTGIVTSVPSDSPDDYAVLVDLKKKPALWEKYGLKEEMIIPFEPVSIIDIPEYSDMAAIKAYQDFKVSSMNDKQKLADAKAEVYLKGFYKGVMKVGEFKGEKVEQAKKLTKELLINTKQGALYYEPENLIISRLGEECVVALCDQWYINYGIENVKQELLNYIESKGFQSFNDNILKSFEDALAWLKEWGCSRSFGLGTRLPWDKQFLIESLSDSTIYMAFYTVSNQLQEDIEGKVPGSLQIKPEEIKTSDWDYVFLQTEYDSSKNGVEKSKLDQMRCSFEYWYPFDLRVSGKDLIKNHLTMSLYNHYFIWGEKYLPKGFFCNGWIQVNHEKMSKSKGNFFTVKDYCEKYSSDAGRLGLAMAGDTVEDSNIELAEVENCILRLTQLEITIMELAKELQNLREDSLIETEFFDKVFEAQIKEIINLTEMGYEKLVIRDVVKEAFYKMNSIREEYRFSCAGFGMKKSLAEFWIKSQLILLAPITPHFSEYIWQELRSLNQIVNQKFMENESKFVIDAVFPQTKMTSEDIRVLQQYEYLSETGKSLRSTVEKFSKKNASKKIKKIYIMTAKKFQDWQVTVLQVLKKCQETNESWQQITKETFKDQQSLMKKAMSFASFKMLEFQESNAKAFDLSIPIDEQEILERNIGLLCKDSVQIEQVQIIDSDTARVSGVKNLESAVDQSLPMRPLVIIDFE